VNQSRTPGSSAWLPASSAVPALTAAPVVVKIKAAIPTANLNIAVISPGFAQR
jgi:hypothetical protein